MNRFRTPALLIVIPALLLPFWYYLNTDAIGSILFGEKLTYCNVIGCAVSRDRFLAGAALLGLLFLTGLVLLVIRIRASRL